MSLSIVCGVFSWVSVFVLTWMLILGQLPLDGTSIFGWVFFLIVGVISGSYRLALSGPSKKS